MGNDSKLIPVALAALALLIGYAAYSGQGLTGAATVTAAGRLARSAFRPFPSTLGLFIKLP